MRVGVVAAMRSEIRPFERLARHGRVGQNEATTAVVGIGTAASATATARLLESGTVDHVVMIGIAGGVGPTVSIGDLVIPEVVLAGASGTSRAPAALPGLAARGSLRTSDDIDVTGAELAELSRAGVIAVDMESAAVAEVCEARGVPWSVVRAVSDHTDDGYVDSSLLAMLGPDGSPRMGAVLAHLLRRPWHVVRLARLARGARRATNASARAAFDAISRM